MSIYYNHLILNSNNVCELKVFIFFQSYRSKSRLFTTSTSGGSNEDNLIGANYHANQLQSSSNLSQLSPAGSSGNTLMPTSNSSLQPSQGGQLTASTSFGVIGSTNVGTTGLTSSSPLASSNATSAVKGKHPNRWSGLWGLSTKVLHKIIYMLATFYSY